MTRMMRSAAIGALVLVGGCATLNQVLQAPRFSAAEGQRSEIRLLGPSSSRPLGGASVRLWARVENPNPLGLTLSRVAGNLFLQSSQAAQVDFPLGVPLQAQQDTVIPLDINLSFSDLPGLANVLKNALTSGTVPYRLEGTFTVDAGPLGAPSFGPSTLLTGDVQVFR